MKLLLVFLLLAGTASAELTWENREIAIRTNVSDTKVTAHFRFTNSGSANLKILAVKSSCGCTTTQLEKLDYAPKESGEILAIFEIGQRIGVQSKTITVQTDDPKVPETVLNLTVTIPILVDINPVLLFWSANSPNNSKTVSVRIPEESPAKLVSVESSSETVSVRLEALKPDREYALHVTPADTSKRTTAEVRLKTQLSASESRDFLVHVVIR